MSIDEKFTEISNATPETNPNISKIWKLHRIVADRAPGRDCPDCGGPVIHASGCTLCVNCGWGRCG